MRAKNYLEQFPLIFFLKGQVKNKKRAVFVKVIGLIPFNMFSLFFLNRGSTYMCIRLPLNINNIFHFIFNSIKVAELFLLLFCQ
jgi:hypothetical protein